MDELIILNYEQLLKLAKVIYYQEVEAIRSIKFKSEYERAKYLGDCRESYQTTLGLLIHSDDLETKLKDDNSKGSIAHDIFCYVKRCVNFALQEVRNYTLRIDYLHKIKEHSSSLMNQLRKMDMKNIGNVQSLAREAVEYKNAMFEYTKKLQKGASRFFSKCLKEEGLTFERLVMRYQEKLGFKGPFKNLKEVQKLQVYEKIIEASGRANATVNKLTKGLGIVGIAVLLFTAAMIVWDVYSSEHKLETTVRATMEVASAVGGAMLGQLVASALATPLMAAGVSAAFLTVTGIVLGIAGAFIIGLFTSWLVGLIFGSGGSVTSITDGLHCYVAPLPDGLVLARQIAHQDRFPSN